MAKKAKKSWLMTLLGLIGTYLLTGLQDLFGIREYILQPDLRKRIPRDFWSFAKQLYQRITTEGVFKEAGSLSYITILGFIPFIVFIIMIAPNLPFLNIKEKIYYAISNNFMPTSAMAVNNIIEGMLTRSAGFNIFSFIILIISSYSLFRVIRDTFDRILNLEFRYKQDTISQIVKFFGTIILGVLIMVVMFSSSSLPLISRILKIPSMQWMIYVLPFLMQFVGLVFLYMMMPSLRVHRVSLIRGAFWTTVVWVLVKSGFDLYIYRLTNYQAVYGVLAALPIFLMWIYVNWVIILSGIAMVSVVEHGKIPHKIKKEPKRMVRLTLEMYSDTKMNARLQRYISKDEVKEVIKTLEEEIEE